MNPWKVLVVDDQPEITTNLENQLLQNGYQVQIAHNYTEAAFMIEHRTFQIAILDIILPDGNGIDLFRKIRTKNEDIYTIMITGNATVENTITALNEGVHSFLIKPFSNQQLTGSLIQAEKTLKLKAENRLLFQEIQNNREFYENLLNSTSEAILVIDLDFKIRFCNQTAQKFLQMETEDFQQLALHTYIEDGFKVLSHIHQKLVMGKSVSGYRVGIKTGEGKTTDVHLNADFLRSKNGSIEGLIINLSNPMIHDEVFNRILRKEKLATIINLANTLGHEIRNPINILFGRLQLLAEELKDENFKNAYESIKRQINRLVNITDLLGKFNFSREDSIPELFIISDILEDILTDEQERFKAKSITTSTFFEKQKYLVEGNLGQFSDAFRYLLEAIAEFTPKGKTIEIKGKVIRNFSKTPWFELQFIIPEVEISTQQLFDPHQSIDMKANGLVGLGMTVMHTIFTNYGARIESFVQNTRHTVIRISFPLQEDRSSDIRSSEDKDELAQLKIRN